MSLLRNKFLSFLLFLTLIGCDTFSTYRIESKQFPETLSSTKGFPDRHKIDLNNIEAEVYISFSRFNFDYGMLFEIENKGKIPLTFDVDDIFVIRTEIDKKLGVEKVWEVDNSVDGKYNRISKDTIATIAPDETKQFSYAFDKIPAFFRRHYGSNNEKHLKLVISGISHLDKKIPVELDLILK